MSPIIIYYIVMSSICDAMKDITYLVDNQWNIQGKVNVWEDETINHDTEEELFNSIKINNLSDYSWESMDYCKRRLILFPDDARTYWRIGKVFYEQKKYKLAGLYFFVMNTLEKWVNHSWAIWYKTRTLKKLMVEGKMDDVRKTLAKILHI